MASEKVRTAIDLKGITHVHHFYFRRALVVFARLWRKKMTQLPMPSC